MSVDKCAAKVVAWDPKSPAILFVPTITNGDGDSANVDRDGNSRMFMEYISSDKGIGCNTFESSAIMSLLDARDAYLDETKTSSRNTAHNHALRQLSKNYRRALYECINDWSEDIENKKESNIEETEENIQQQKNLDRLKATFAFTQLSETFFLLPSINEDRSGLINSIGYGFEDDMWNLPGAVTADTIRYLRMHHLDVEDLFDQSYVDDLLEKLQPDRYDENTYWKLVETYIIWGCLERAWEILSHHSIVSRLFEMEQQQLMLRGQYDGAKNGSDLNDYQAASLAEDRDGFRALKNIFLSAPLPGGRNDDSSAEFDDFEDDNRKAKKGSGQNEKNDNENPAAIAEEFIEGVPTSAYNLWEINGRNGRDKSRAGDFPVNFEPNAAYQVHQYWQQSIGAIPSLDRLRRRIPQLNNLLNLLAGNFRDIEFDSWRAELCAELLYKNPNIRLDDVNIRAQALVRKHESKDEADGIYLAIMRGNDGEAIKAMYNYGGGSGAALPAVMTSLLSQLLGDARALKDPTGFHNINIDLLLEASSAIRSSLVNEGCDDLAKRLAVRLLLPHITIDSDLRITGTLVDILEHHSPKTDSEASSLLSLCRKLIERKNVRVLDGCVSICLARYCYYVGERRPNAAVHWLRTGMELESQVLCKGSKRSGFWQRSLASGVCYRRLVAYFTDTSRSLLKGLLGEEKGTLLVYEQAKAMVAATKDESSNDISLTSFVPGVKLLENIITIAGAIVERKENSVVANSIVSCLEERPNDEDDGVVSSLARSLNWDLLRLATAILERDAKNAQSQIDMHKNKESSIASFDVRGIGVLLSVFTIEVKTQELKEQQDTLANPEEELQRTRLILAEGLKRAFVADNSLKKVAKSKRLQTSASSIYAANFSKHSREDQERAVQMMLEC